EHAILYNSTSSVGIFFANAHRSYFDADISQPNMLTLGADGGDLDLFIFPGPMDRILERYTALTGRMPLPPLYALGFQQSRYSYETEEDVRAVARNFRENHVPCDILYLDIDYMHGYRVFTWDPSRFPYPSRLLSDLKKDGFGVVPIIDPGVKVDSHYPVYQEGRRDAHFLTYTNGEEFQSQVWPGMCAFPDFLQPRTRQWWGQQHRTLVEQGIAGIWNDMNEPAWNRGGSGHYGHDNDADVEQRDGITSYSHSAVHNLYALCEAQATFEGLRDASQMTTAEGRSTHLRPFILSRSGFSGIQRYAAVWTGDNCSWWEHLALSIPMCLNLGMSGVAFCGPDAGGFQHNASPFQHNASPELYARWIQMGVFFPFLRAHSAKNTHRHEPWSFGPDVLTIARQYIEYRYRLLPYWYSLFHLASQTGVPPMRPLVWEFGEDRETWDIDDQFLVGSSLMVAPIIRPGTYERRVYFPPGHWFDVWNQEEIVGPSSHLVAAPLNRLPLFLKAGSIIPLGPRVLSTAQQTPQELAQGTDGPREFFVIQGEGHFLVYSDDGKTDQCLHGAYRTINIKVIRKESVTRVSWNPEHWPSEAKMLSGSYLVHVGYYHQAPRRVISDNHPLIQVQGHPNAGQWVWHETEHRISAVLPSMPTPGHSVDLVIED
ncbi:MAG: glycoside hydrolase family 31 protein, partial [Firmicutes bacterium]|nr:glycoside hydrolase family 31 protein [Bacillota bacterium]